MAGGFEHPYKALPDYAFWRSAVAGVSPEDFDPIVSAPIKITKSDPVVTAGSCFAQHIARALAKDGFNFLVTERPSADEQAAGAETIYSARYGNIYSTLQLKQLFDRAYGQTIPVCTAWTAPDGRLVDAFRPNEFPLRFATERELLDAQELHYAQTRLAFETCGVFIFTLGLTETWVCAADGMAAPVAPNVVAAPPQGFSYGFRNLTVPEMTAQLAEFIDNLRIVNPQVRVVLTVSPVPLVATYEPRNVLVSTTYSKAALRVVAETVANALPGVTYFPSYEMVAMLPGADAFEEDLRSVKSTTVERVMRVFRRHFTSDDAYAAERPAFAPPRLQSAITASISEFKEVNCDEELLYPSER